MLKRMILGLLAVVMLSFVSVSARATDADDDEAVRLLRGRGGVYYAIIAFKPLFQNDFLPGRIVDKGGKKSPKGKGIRSIHRIGPKKGTDGFLLITFKKSFVRKVMRNGFADTRLKYFVKTACKPKCKTPKSFANIFLTVLFSPNRPAA